MDVEDDFQTVSAGEFWHPSMSSNNEELGGILNAKESSDQVYVKKSSRWLEAGDPKGEEDVFPVNHGGGSSFRIADPERSRGLDNAAAELYEATMYFDSTQTWDAIENAARRSKLSDVGASDRVPIQEAESNGASIAGLGIQKLSEETRSPIAAGRDQVEIRKAQARIERERSPTSCFSTENKSPGLSTPSSEIIAGTPGAVLINCFVDRRMSGSSPILSKDCSLESETECFTESFTKTLSKSCFRVASDLEAITRNPGEIVVAVNAGGSSPALSSSGIEYSKDQLFLGGDVLRTEDEISETSDPSLYQTARYGNVSYKLADLPSGEYFVDLHFAEIVFTNGPSGMRVFDVYIQGEKVISDLDVYAEVGSNKALILCGKASVTCGTLLIALDGVTGNPTISAICVRRAPFLDTKNEVLPQTTVEGEVKVEGPGVRPAGTLATLSYTDVGNDMDSLPPLMVEHKSRRQQIRNKARKSVLEYEAKVEELKNECHEAWISLQEANRKIERLQNDTASKSVTVDALASAVESQEIEMKELREKADGGTQRWKIAAINLLREIELLKVNYGVFARETKDWICTFPDTSAMFTTVGALVNEHEVLKKKYAEESQERKQLYNKVLELKGNIRVFCRCRPLSAFEVTSGAASVVDFDSVKDNELVLRSGNAKKLFKFDCVFTPQDDQGEVFANTAPVVVSVLDGYNVCIFAYGQTGTGKTFTMEGTPDNRGVNYRTLEELFDIAEQRKALFKYEISVSLLEVYNEHIRDLLAPPADAEQPVKKLEIRQVAEGGHHVPGLLEAHVNCMEEVWDVLQSGSSARAVGSTNANEHSSRSHCMLCVMVKGQNLITEECTRSKLWMVDLAGSERVAKTDVQGERLKEAQSINKSLSALGDVMAALATKSSHIPFRNSKLTHLLQDSLGGDSKTLMFVQISPSEDDAGESLCSLNFASRVRGVELGPARKHLDSSELFKYKQLAERAKQDGRTKEEAVKKLEDTLRTMEVKLKVKEHLYQALIDKVKDKDKALADLEGQVAAEKKARLAAQVSVKEKVGSQVERAVGSKDARGLPERRPLMEKNQEGGDGVLMNGGTPSVRDSVERLKPHFEDTDQQQCEASPNGAPSKPAVRTKVVQSRYNSPTLGRKITRRPMRASIATTYQVNPATLTSSFSSDESGVDAAKENSRFPSDVREVHGSAFIRPRPTGIPSISAAAVPGRKAVHFATPVLVKEREEEQRTREDNQHQANTQSATSYRERSLSLGGASDPKKLGVGKFRRVSIARPFGRFPTTSTGGPQRVLNNGSGAGVKPGLPLQTGVRPGLPLQSGVKSGPPLQSQHRERRWN